MSASIICDEEGVYEEHETYLVEAVSCGGIICEIRVWPTCGEVVRW